MVTGDSNSTRRDLDEEVPFLAIPEEHFLDDMQAAGWTDAYRHLHGTRRIYSWYSPNGGNGYRIDQTFVSRRLRDRVRAARYAWGSDGDSSRRDAVSDHAALLVDFRSPDPVG